MEPGTESALLDLLDAPKRNKALQFVLANASLVVGWKQAGLSHADIAVLLARLGCPVTAKRVSALYVRAKALADPERSGEVARGIDAARLARALPAPMAGRAETPPPEAVKPAPGFPAVVGEMSLLALRDCWLVTEAPNSNRSPDHG